MKTCVLIPTYNEAKTIGDIVRNISRQKIEVVVIDDGSRDHTPQIARDSGAVVLQNQSNQGKGASLLKGFDYVLKRDFEAVITLDGDGQHLPEDIPYFIRLARYSDTGIFIGNRMLKARGMPPLRYLTNKFMSCFISRVTGQNIPDTQCGFRLIKRSVLERIRIKTCKYETESEVLIQAARRGFKIESVPIKTIYSGEKSQINPLMDTLRFIKYIINEFLENR